MIKKQCRRDDYQWHRWFAWYPVYTSSVHEGNRYCWYKVWWCNVWRKRYDFWGSGEWQYRITDPTSNAGMEVL